MQELLKKIGLPATVAASVAAVVAFVPFAFKVDERYTKDNEFKAQVLKIERESSELRTELAQLNGFQQAMLALIQQSKPRHAAFEPTELGAKVMTVQFKATQKIKAQDEAASAVEKQEEQAKLRTDVDSKRTKPKIMMQPNTWKELQEGLVQQQLRLQKSE